MADADTVVLESKASAEVQAKAQAMGWIPPDRYRGEPERFTDAQEYIDRGEQVLPIIRSNNKRLEAELATLREQSAAQSAALDRATKALEEIEERHSVATVKAVEAAKRELVTQLAAASEAGDHAKIAEITGLMVDLNAAVPEKKKESEAEPTPKLAALPEDLVEWNRENPWFGSDKRKTALAIGIAQELRDGGTKLTGRAFYEKVKEEMEETLGERKEPASKVEGARGSGEGGGAVRGGGAKSYAALPAEAKAACDADAKSFVGPNKKYKTTAEWQKRYAELYFQE